VLLLGTTFMCSGRPALAQLPPPAPVKPNVEERSGLLSRYTSIIPTLPPDPKRDNFYDTKYGDYPLKIGRDNMFNGGLYGERWKGDCTATVLPHFWGTPSNTIGPHCKTAFPAARWYSNFVHPFRPVGMYYDRGVFVPIYDLDPWVPGPGPFPWPCFIRRPLGG
jgi:hypothetical protein